MRFQRVRFQRGAVVLGVLLAATIIPLADARGRPAARARAADQGSQADEAEAKAQRLEYPVLNWVWTSILVIESNTQRLEEVNHG